MKNLPYTRPTISKKDLISVLEHLIDQDLSNGETIKKFEKELGRVVGLNNRVLLTNSGSTCLFLILQHLDIKAGDEIIVSVLSELWVWEVINYFSATPVWVDISVETLQMNPEQLLKKINSRTRAVIIHHHFGYPFFMNQDLTEKGNFSLQTYLKKFPNIKIIEDLTTGLFTQFQNQYLGTFGDYAFTCFESHRIITTGRGGAIFTKNKKEAKEIHFVRSYKEKINIEEKQDYTFKRLDLSLSDMQAALGLSELSLVNKMIVRCEQIKQFYQDSISKGKHSFIGTEKEIISNNFTFPVILQGDVNTAKKIFDKEKIEIKGITQDTCYEQISYDESLKNIHKIKHTVILLPIYPTLKKEEIEKITLLVNSIQ